MFENGVMRRGDTLDIGFIITYDGRPTYVDGVLTFTMKSDLSDSDPGALQYSVRIHDNQSAPQGLLEMAVPAALTSLLSPGKYYYDVQFVTSDGKVITVWPRPGENDTVDVQADVTQSNSIQP
jgi:hypothetical protein